MSEKREHCAETREKQAQPLVKCPPKVRQYYEEELD